jgi:phosphatidylserine/phosphatidylglycerophosphate/cardiolipin synthase-like enzyme
METRRIEHIHHALLTTAKQSLFGKISALTQLAEPPIPLTAGEMHKVSGEIIRSAKHEVLMAFYKFSGASEGGKEIISALEALKEKAEREKTKIRVCLLVNSRGKLAETVYKPNRSLGIDHLASSEWFTFTFVPHPTAAFGALHSKLIIVDAEIAMVRGGDPHADNDATRAQFETASLIRGGIVSEIRYDFVDVWQAYSSEVLGLLKPSSLQSIPTHTDQSPIPCLYVSKRENGNLFYYTDCFSPYKIAFLHAVNEAKETIHVMTSNINDPDICSAIAKACNRGVQLYLITGKFHNDHTEYYWGGTNLYAIATIVSQVDLKCLKNLHVRWNTNTKSTLVKNSDPFTIHAKYACVDLESIGLTFCGSSPLDIQAMKYSREGDLIFEDVATAKKYNDKFFVDKFAIGKDYFTDAFETLLEVIETQTKRIEQSIESEDQRRKAEGMRGALINIGGDSRHMLEKIMLLMENIHPYLIIRTGYKPGAPESYNAVMEVVTRYGLHIHLATVLKQKLPEWQMSAQNHAPAVTTVATSHFSLLKGKNEKEMTRSASFPDLLSPRLANDEGHPAVEGADSLRKSM